MSIEGEQLDFVLRVVDDASAQLARVRGELGNVGTQAEATDKGLGGVVGALGDMAKAAVAGAAIGAVTGFLVESTKAAIDEEAGLARLSASLRANVADWNGNTSSIEATIKTREALAFSDDSLRNSLAILVGSTHDVSKAFDIQSTAMDLARFKGISLEDASSALIKVEGGHYRALQELGIILPKNATATEALAAVQRVAGGQAQAFGDTTSGAMQAAGIAVHDLEEEVGQKLSPVIKDAAVTLRTQVIPAIEGIGGAVHDVLGPLGDLVHLIGQIGGNTNVTDALIATAQAAEANVGPTLAWEAANRTLQSGLTDLQSQFANNKISEEEYRQGQDALQAQYDKTVGSIDILARKQYDEGAGLDNVTASAAAARAAVEGFSASTVNASGDLLDSSNSTRTEIGALDGIKDSAISAADGINRVGAASTAAGNAAAGAANKFAYLAITAWQAGHPSATDAPNSGAYGADTMPTGGMSTTDAYLAGAFDPKAHPIVTGGGASGRSNSAATAAAQAAAQAIKDAYGEAKTAGDQYIDDVHAKKDAVISAAHDQREQLIESSHQTALAQIEDAHKVANEQIQAARKAVDQQLADQMRLNAAPVTAAEKALRDKENAQQLRDLEAAAKANPNDVHAQEALSNFRDQMNIDQLRAQQQQADDQAKAAADAAKAELDAKQKAEDDTYTKEKADEQATYDTRKAEEATRYKAAQDDEDARYKLQKTMFDDNNAALAANAKATKALADQQTAKFLADQLALHPDGDPDHALAVYEYNKFAKAHPDLGLVPARAAGGPVRAGDLYRVNETGQEYFSPGTDGTVIPLGGRGGGGGNVTIQLGGPVFLDKYGMAADQLVDLLLPAIQRALTQQRMTLG